MTRCAIYCRVSTSEQSVDMQVSELREYATARGWSVTEYVDKGISGAKDSRPALNAMMQDCKARKIDTVLVWKLDRLGRSLKHLVVTLDEFTALGITFVSLKDSIDLSTPTGRMLCGIVSVFAEFERNMIVERVRAGIANARAKGKRIGRRATPPVIISRVISAHLEGMSIREIADKVDVPRATAFDAVKRFKAGEINREGLAMVV